MDKVGRYAALLLIVANPDFVKKIIFDEIEVPYDLSHATGTMYYEGIPSAREASREMHRLHVADPTIRGRAIQLVAQALDTAAEFWGPVEPDANAARAKAVADMTALKLGINDDISAVAGSSWTKDHKDRAQDDTAEYPIIYIWAVDQIALKEVEESLLLRGYKREG